MTTPSNTTQRVVVVDDVGVLAVMSPEVAARLLASGQCARTDRPDVFSYTPKGRTAMRQLSPVEKRALVLAKERAAKR